MQPGFYFAFGETLPDQQDEASPVRLYWNVQESGVLELVRCVTRELNRFQIPFRFKCLTRAGLYVRSDAAVLYVAKRLYRVVAELLADSYQRLAGQLRADTPLFSKPLAPGLGLAEIPATAKASVRTGAGWWRKRFGAPTRRASRRWRRASKRWRSSFYKTGWRSNRPTWAGGPSTPTTGPRR